MASCFMRFIRKKNVNGHQYVYEVESYQERDGAWRQRVVRYIGPTDPIYGGRGRVDLETERAKLERRKQARALV